MVLSLSFTVPPPHHHPYHHVRTQQEGRQLQARKTALFQKPTMLKPWSWTSNMQNYEKRNFCCPSHSVYGIFVLAACAAKGNLHTSKVIPVSKGSLPKGAAGTERKKQKTQTPRRTQKETVKGIQGDLQAELQLNPTIRNRSKRS